MWRGFGEGVWPTLDAFGADGVEGEQHALCVVASSCVVRCRHALSFALAVRARMATRTQSQTSRSRLQTPESKIQNNRLQTTRKETNTPDFQLQASRWWTGRAAEDLHVRGASALRRSERVHLR
eukprot:1475930-Rhodomonas_salina.1